MAEQGHRHGNRDNPQCPRPTLPVPAWFARSPKSARRLRRIVADVDARQAGIGARFKTSHAASTANVASIAAVLVGRGARVLRRVVANV